MPEPESPKPGMLESATKALKEIREGAPILATEKYEESKKAVKDNAKALKKAFSGTADKIKNATKESLADFQSEFEFWKNLKDNQKMREAFDEELGQQIEITTTSILAKWKSMTVMFDKGKKTVVDSLSSGLDYVVQKLEGLYNSAAYALGPILESLSKINLPMFGNMQANIEMILGFLGANRVMVYASIRKQKIEPVFDQEKPENDSQAVEKIVAMAKEVNAVNKNYTLKGFFDAAALEFADHLKKKGRSTFKMDELVAFTKDNVLEKEKKNAKELPTPSPEKPAEVVLKTVDGKIEASGGGKSIKIARETDGKLTIEKDGKKEKWGIALEGMDVFMNVQTLEAPSDNSVKMKVKTPDLSVIGIPPTEKEHTLNNDETAAIYAKIQNNESYKFTIVEEKDGKKKEHKLEFKKIY